MGYKGVLLAALNNFALIGFTAYLTTQLPAFRRTLNNQSYEWRDKVFLILLFGAMSIVGNMVGMPVFGSLANSRIVGPIVGGLLGGPVVGMGAGLLGAVHRYTMGGFTMWAAVTANIIAGYISGRVFMKYGPRGITIKRAFYTALAAEGVLKILVLTMSKPFSAAWELEKLIALPTIVGNSFTVIVFIYIVQDIFNEQDKVQAKAAQQAMKVIRQAGVLLHNGLDEHVAVKLADILYSELMPGAVAVTSDTHVLAFKGSGSDHHIKGMPIITASTKISRESGQPVIRNSKEEIGCPYNNCPLTAVVDVPLMVGGEYLGSIKIFKTGNQALLSYEVELIFGIGDYLASQLAYYKMNEQKRLLVQAEYNMLKAQVNPHFLFNTLATIRVLIRNDAQMARILIKDLSDLLRCTLTREREIITLQEELDTVQRYVRLEQARFGSRILFVQNIPPELLKHPIPVFTVQPLVENSIKHGLSPLKQGGTVSLSAWINEDSLFLAVADNGIGMTDGKIAAVLRGNESESNENSTGIGIVNVERRLRQIYNERGGLNIISKETQGTKVIVFLPLADECAGKAETKEKEAVL